jgi:hypothetical protein
MAEPKFEGEKVRVGDRDLIVPSLSVKQARRLWPEILELDKGITPANLPEKFGQAIPIIHAAISRNYPDITADELEDQIDVKTLRKLLLIVSGQSGMTPGEKLPVASAKDDPPVVH